MVAPVPGVPLTYKPAALVKPSKEARDGRWMIVWWQYSTEEGKVVRRRQGFDLNSITDRKSREKRGSDWCTAINSLLKQGYTYSSQPVASLPDARPVPTTVEEVWAAFLLTKQTLSKGGKSNYKGIGDILLPWCGKQGVGKLTDLTPAVGKSFLDHLRRSHISSLTGKLLSAKSTNNYGFCLKTFQGWALEQGYFKLGALPFASMKKAKTGKSEHHKPYTQAQLTTILEVAQADAQFHLYLHFLYYTFARPRREVRLLRVRDLRETTLWITQDHDKNRVGRFCDIPPHLNSLIEEAGLRSFPPDHYLFTRQGQPGPTPVGFNYFYRKLVPILLQLGLSDQHYTLYGFKHSGNIQLWLATKDLRAIQKQNGHTTMAMSETYLRGLGLLQNDQALAHFPKMGG
ncbi:hypothetical protein GCM10027422_07340 [Hymenobacter arcticus]